MIKKIDMRKFASKIAFSFFFAAIFVLFFYFVIDEKVSTYINLINVTAVKKIDSVRKTKYNIESKRLINYPAFGEKYAELIMPSVDRRLPIYHGDTLRILKYGVGHFAGSYFPGEEGTIVLAAHNSEAFFRRLEDLKDGDMVTIEATYGTFNYKVDSHKIVSENDLEAFHIESGTEKLIMYTCYPMDLTLVGHRTKRYVVYATKVGDSYE